MPDHRWPLVGRARLVKQTAKAAQMKEWFESAMVMVDNVPRGIAWGDPEKGFHITYINGFGRKCLAPALAAGETLDDRSLLTLFPDLAAHRRVLEQGAATAEIAQNANEVSANTGRVSSNVAGLAGNAEEVRSAASRVLGASGSLGEETTRMMSEVDGFLAAMGSGR